MAITFTVASGLEENLPSEGATGKVFLTRDTQRLLFGMGANANLVPLKVRLEDLVGLLSGNTIDPDLLPDLAISSVRGVETIAERDALRIPEDVQQGDSVVVADDGNGRRAMYVLDDGGNWLKTSAQGAVDSVNGEVGQVVLTTDKVNEGQTNLYYTDARVGQYLAGVINKKNGVAGVNADGKLSVSVLPASVVRSGQDATRLGSGDASEGALFAATGDGNTEWVTTIDGGGF